MLTNKEPQVQLSTLLFGVEQVVDPSWPSLRAVMDPDRAELRLAMDADQATMTLTRAGLGALGLTIRAAAQYLSRAEYWMRTSLAQSQVLAVADAMTSEAGSFDVTLPLERGREATENPRRPRPPAPPGKIRPSSRLSRGRDGRLKVYDPEEGWVPEGGVRGAWIDPPDAPRPSRNMIRMSIFEIDQVRQPDLWVAALEPAALYRVSLPGGTEADYYTVVDPVARYVETEQTVPGAVNLVLDAPQPDTTYVVHPTGEGRRSIVLRTDAQARVVQARTDALVRSGAVGHPMVELFGGGSERVSVAAVIDAVAGEVREGLAVLAASLGQAVDQGRSVAVCLTVSHDDAGVPSALRVDYTVDGTAQTASFLTR
ncbi:MAG: hypothetical protein LBU50_04600 [Cellulomonas sp.]|nr:hypothetical protein [Cellulomonas sp.]